MAKVNPNPGGAVVVTDRYAAQNGKTIEAMVAAVIEANRALYNDRAFFERVVDKWFPGIYSAEQKDVLYKAYPAVVGRERRPAIVGDALRDRELENRHQSGPCQQSAIFRRPKI